MKLRNKKTGEIVENAYIRESHDFYNKRTIAVFVRNGNRPPERVSTGYETLSELNADWEDAPEEPKKYWFIDAYGNIVQNEITKHYGDEYTDMTDAYESQKQIGNRFETEGEAEKAVKKLKALKRLKEAKIDSNLTCDFDNIIKTMHAHIFVSFDCYPLVKKDLELLVGGEE